MNDFSRPTITSIKPSLVLDKDAKQKFVDRLKGKINVKVLNVASGVMFTVCNEGTGGIQSIMKHGDRWMMWGTVAEPTTLTNNELEEYLSEQWDIAYEKDASLRISDEFGCLEWLPK